MKYEQRTIFDWKNRVLLIWSIVYHNIVMKKQYFRHKRLYFVNWWPWREHIPLLKPPGAHTAKLGRMTMRKIPPPLATLPNPVLSRLSGHSDPIVLQPFDVTLWYTQVCHERRICLRFHRISKTILEMAFRSSSAKQPYPEWHYWDVTWAP